jgi:hypothetical protein
LSELACSVRLNIDTTEEKIESFLGNLVKSPEPEKLIDVANQVAHVSIFESIPLEGMECHLKQKKEKQRLEEEIKHSRAILEGTNVDVQTINEHKQLEEELSKYDLSSEDHGKLLTVLNNIRS